jgi:hypothetical protein
MTAQAGQTNALGERMRGEAWEAETFAGPLDAARAYVAAGLSVIPVARNGSKAPGRDLPREMDPDTGKFKPTWKPFQTRPPKKAELEKWFARADRDSVAIVHGVVSGNAEMIDFDKEAETIFPEWCNLVEAE